MITCLLAVSVLGGKSQAQDLLSNVYGRDYQLLNGKWGAIVDLYDQGERMQVYKNMKTRPIMDGFRKNNVNYWVFREIRSIIPHL